MTTLFADEPLLSNIRQITFPSMGFEKAGEAYFSNDESKIIFQAVPAGKVRYQMYVMDLQEGVPRLVSTGRGACTCGNFSPDGKKILFASSHESPFEAEEYVAPPGKYEWDLTPYMNIYEANLDGSELKKLTSGSAYHAECSYSPDGSEILFASNESGSMNLYVMNRDGSDVRQLTFDQSCYNGGPFFSPDGGKIVFRADKEKKHFLQLYVMDADGLNLEQLTDNGFVNWAPFWHPDGKRIAYTTSRHGHLRYEIYLLDLLTGQEKRVTDSPSFDGLPVFNSNGTKLLWTSKRSEDGSCQIFMADFKN